MDGAFGEVNKLGDETPTEMACGDGRGGGIAAIELCDAASGDGLDDVVWITNDWEGRMRFTKMSRAEATGTNTCFLKITLVCSASR